MPVVEEYLLPPRQADGKELEAGLHELDELDFGKVKARHLQLNRILMAGPIGASVLMIMTGEAGRYLTRSRNGGRNLSLRIWGGVIRSIKIFGTIFLKASP